MRQFYLFFLLLGAATTFAQQNIDGTLQFDGAQRQYTVHLPPDHDPDQVWPLVINMHGYTSNRTEQQFYAQMDPVADENGFIVVYPDGLLNSWNVGWFFASQADDVGFIDALIDELIAEYGVNPNRVYATGMSNGGFMSYRLACELSDRIVAIASVTGGMVPGLASDCDPGRPVPVLQMHGTADGVVAYDGSLITAPVDSTIAFWRGYNGCQGDSIVTEVPDVDPDDGSTAQNIRFEDCDEGSAVEFYRITGGGHTWPGADVITGVTNQDFDGSTEIWRFFSQFSFETEPSSLTETARLPVVRLGPNPFRDRIQVSLDGLEAVVVRDWSGREVYRTQLRSGETMDLGELASGSYLLELRASGYQVKRKVIKL